MATDLLSLWHECRRWMLMIVVAVITFTVIQYNKPPRRPAVPNGGPAGGEERKDVKGAPQPPQGPSSARGIDEKARSSSSERDERPAKKASPSNGPKRVRGVKPAKKNAAKEEAAQVKRVVLQPMVFYLSLTGTTEARAQKVCDRLKENASASSSTEGTLLEPQLHDLSYIDFDDYFIKPPKPVSPYAEDSSVRFMYIYLIIVPSYNIDTVMSNFLIHLDETHNDFRIDSAPLSSLAGYSVFGFGDKEGWPTEEEGFCYQAREVDVWMAKLTGRKRAFPLGVGDTKMDCEVRMGEWCDGVVEVMKDMVAGKGLGEGVPGSGDPIESEDEEEYDVDEAGNVKQTGKRKQKESAVQDLEDIGGKPAKGSAVPVDFTTYKGNSPSSGTTSAATAKEMVPTTSPTYAALTKQGYTIVGSHSGVKICRWTKSALRGRGSCYKNSFYGIKSHLCMETTPSLSCSNKCVFCWRHGTNPVGTTWRWKVDPPDMIFNGAKEGHYKKIKLMRGVPGVRAERFQEAMRIRHCALSLVGEPIFYPHINEFLALLHREHISSFLVCNAQHPDQLARLDRVTQLYVSIDASDRDTLRKIDRPLHRDFWERFMACLDILRGKRDFQRTVYRLTLVKGFNVDEEVRGYADLVEKGLPCFVEVKGVTYCGTSTSAGAGLTMQNVPFYHEVVDFVVALNAELERRGLEYGIGAEHAHSCCVLLASKRFYVNDKWHTRIDYERFFELLEREQLEGIGFKPEDYMRETEEWALWGNGGFDPNDTRVYRKGKGKKQAVEAAAAAASKAEGGN
ncbi:hypothetical protein KEM55_005610 [Ascosphaera atra]|nr:hypothetical protein KEM55_005610 [Ascosphaera atra]